MPTTDRPTRSPRRTRGPRRLLLLTALLALLATGCNLRSMGASFSGQLGDGATLTRTTPVVAGTITFTAVSAGAIHSCGIADAGTLHCWGEGTGNRLGLGADVAERTEPTQVGTATDWKVVSAGDGHTCGIRGSQRHLYCWGSNDQGRSVPSGGERSPETPVPTLVDPRGGWATVSAGIVHSCAIDADGRLFCWGSNADGRLGAGDTQNPDVLRQVPGTWRSVSADEHTCGIRVDDTLHCWGRNDDGELGTGNRETALAPRAVTVPAGWTAVDTGRDHTCGLRAGGELRCWGAGANGRLGTGTATDRLAPIVISPGVRWLAVSAGAAHSCAIRSDRAALCWGENGAGQLGNGDTVDRGRPVAVTGIGPDDEGAVSVSAGQAHTHIVLAAEA